MNRYGQNSGLNDYTFLFSSSSKSLQNAHYLYYDRRLRTQQTAISNASLTSFATYSTPRFQDNNESSTTLADLSEPISVFDDIKPKYHQSVVTPLPLPYIGSGTGRYSSMSDERFAVASVMRQRLLQDIERSMTEIDEEIHSLKQRSSLSNYTPARLSPLRAVSKTSSYKSAASLKDDSQLWPRKTKRAYQVIPRIASLTKTESQQSTPKAPDKVDSNTFRAEYHYAPEIEEVEIRKNDPENSDRQSPLYDISQFSYNETISLEQFSREQSDMAQHRALISVPEYGDNHDIKTNQLTDDILPIEPIKENTLRSSTIQSAHELGPTNKLSIEDFQSLIQTVPSPKVETPREDIPKTPESTNQTESNLHNTMLTKPVKHSRPLVHTQDTITTSEPIKQPEKNADGDQNYFFSDFGNEYEAEEDLISIDPLHFAAPIGSDIISEDNASGTLLEQAQTPLLNSHPSQQQQQQPLSIENINNNPNAKATEKKKIDATAEHIVTSNSTSPSKKLHQISIYDDFQNESEKNKNNSNEHQRTPSITSLSINKNQQKSQDRLNNLSPGIRTSQSPSIHEREAKNRTPSSRLTPTDQRPRSITEQSISIRQVSTLSSDSTKHQSKANLSRTPSLDSLPDITKAAREQIRNLFDEQQETPAESRQNSALPVVRTSPDSSDNQISKTSRPATPERRNSISSIDQNMLFSSNDIMSLEDTSAENPHTTSFEQINNQEHEEPSQLSNMVLSQNDENNIRSDEIKPELSSNQNQYELSNQRNSTMSPKNEHENDRIKSVSPVTTETKRLEDEDQHLPSLSRHHTHISDGNLTSIEREDTFPQPISLEETHKDQVEKPVTPVVEPTLIDESQSRIEDKHLPTSEMVQEQIPPITASQQRSKLSLLVLRPTSRKKKSSSDQLSQKHVDPSIKNKYNKSEVQRHVLFSDETIHFEGKENPGLKNWRDRIDAILTKKQSYQGKYSHVTSRVNTFANFEYHPKQIISPSKKKSKKKTTNGHGKGSQSTDNKNQTRRRSSLKTTAPLFGRLQSLPDGTAKIFNEKLQWNAKSKLRSYSMENYNYRPTRSQFKIFHEKPRWHSESRVAELIKSSPSQEVFLETLSLVAMPDSRKPVDQEQQTGIEVKIFDVKSNIQQEGLDNVPLDSKQPAKLIYHKRLLWKKHSKIRDTIWENKDYQPQQSQVKIFHESVHWNTQSKLRITHSLNMSIPHKIKYWSEADIPELSKNKALFAQYYDPKWNDVEKENIDPTLVNNALENDPKLKEYITENLDETFQNQTQVESPANRPKWNGVSKTRSDNLIYNPKISNSNSIRRGWDLELRRKRVHKLPPIKRKKVHNQVPPLAIDDPSSNDHLAIDYNYDRSPAARDHMTSTDYATVSSRRTSRMLAPLPHIPALELPSETPRSQRPIQQEWYEDVNKSRLTHRKDTGRNMNDTFRESLLSVHYTNTPRDTGTVRSSTRNSQNSVMSNPLLDSSIRTNRATELRLSKDMEEYHNHSHDPSQSMPIEIRGFRLEGTSLNVPNNATIRPLSNISYQISERIKTRRTYPWSILHTHGTVSRNSSLLPIAEFRHPSLQSSLEEIPQSIHEE